MEKVYIIRNNFNGKLWKCFSKKSRALFYYTVWKVDFPDLEIVEMEVN